MSDYVDKVDIEGIQYDIQDTITKQQTEENAQDIAEIKVVANYSLTERLTGRKWLDGRPTYEKTIDCGALPNASVKYVSHGILNLFFVVKGNLTSKNPSANQYVPDTFVHTPVASCISFYIQDSKIAICTGSDRTVYSQTFVTLEYTKSTDNPQP